MQDADDHAPDDVFFLVVPYLVGQHGYQLGDGVLGDEGVEEGDALVAAEAGEEGVGLAGAPRPVDDEKVLHREGDRAGIAEDGRPAVRPPPAV